jgi:hypothetical protein
MNSLYTIIVAANLGTAGQATLGDWQLWWHESSGWGGRPAIYVDSKGRNYAYGDRQVRELYADMRRGAAAQYCEELPVAAEQLRKIESQISRIPRDALEHGGFEVRGNCFDEIRQGLVLSMRGETYRFSYSTENSCNGGTRVPDWLTALVRELRNRYQTIKDCGVAAEGQVSPP